MTSTLRRKAFALFFKLIPLERHGALLLLSPFRDHLNI